MIPVIIPSKTSSNLFPCVAAVAQREPSAQIVVVDDGLDRIPGNVDAIHGEKPFVFSRNVNIGIRHALEAYGGRGVIVMNDDAILETPLGFNLMANAAAEHPEYGIIGSTCNNVGQRNQWRREGEELRFEPRMVCFVCVYIPRTTLSTVGLLDEQFTGYGFEDDDYCVRVRKAGLKVGIHDGCYVDHGSLVSTFRGKPMAPGQLNEGRRIFKQKWGADNHAI